VLLEMLAIIVMSAISLTRGVRSAQGTGTVPHTELGLGCRPGGLANMMITVRFRSRTSRYKKRSVLIILQQRLMSGASANDRGFRRADRVFYRVNRRLCRTEKGLCAYARRLCRSDRCLSQDGVGEFAYLQGFVGRAFITRRGVTGMLHKTRAWNGRLQVHRLHLFLPWRNRWLGRQARLDLNRRGGGMIGRLRGLLINDFFKAIEDMRTLNAAYIAPAALQRFYTGCKRCPATGAASL